MGLLLLFDFSFTVRLFAIMAFLMTFMTFMTLFLPLYSHKPVEQHSQDAAASCCGGVDFLLHDKLGKAVAVVFLLQHVP